VTELPDQALVVGRARRAADGWREAIRVACEPLVEQGAAEARYPDRCIEMVDEHGPYIVLAPGIALAHARPEDGVLKLGVSAVTLAEPVTFGHEDNDPVDLVFAFGSPDRDQHVGLLSKLATALLDGLADRLRAAEDDEDAQTAVDGLTHD
jgi:ascorbate PTS system EIIA or EIIAB component